ncbi:hypothetical protein ACQ86N_08495 [Puia sp. P3]|uniref:hypothetical protein n=1 Tax=Puia sp. P3 TaxID=3423952 RepID=UPI003D667A1A
MKKTTKISLAAIQGKLSRAEMKKIMAGSEAGCDAWCNCTQCLFSDNTIGSCRASSSGSCYCATGTC